MMTTRKPVGGSLTLSAGMAIVKRLQLQWPSSSRCGRDRSNPSRVPYCRCQCEASHWRVLGYFAAKTPFGFRAPTGVSNLGCDVPCGVRTVSPIDSALIR